MKIALVGRYGEGEILTGPERVARELFSELKKKNIQSVFIEYFFSGYRGTSFYKKIFGKEYFENQSILRLGLVPFLLTLFNKKKQIVHIVNSQRFVIFLLILKPFFSCNIVTTLHGFVRNEIPKNSYWRKRYYIDLWVERLLVKNSLLMIFPSELLYYIFNRHYKISNRNYKIIPNGISSTFYNQSTTFPNINNLIRLVFYNGFDGAINKGLNELMELLNNVDNKVEIYVIGKEANVNSSKNITVINAGSKTHEELIIFLKDKHFIIKSQAFDTFSMIITECMCLGLIPIISENIGVKEIIIHKVNGFIYNHNSREELPNLLNEIFERKYNLDIISSNAKKIYEQLNWGKITQQYLDAYQSLL